MPDLTGKVALVTGAGGGIGRACVNAFIAAGASVVVADRDNRAGKATVDGLPPDSPAVFVETDVTDADSVRAAVAAAVGTFGGLHIAHNNAGVEAAGRAVADMTDTDWHRVIDVNLTGVWQCMRAQIPAMLDSGGGSIVNTSSALGLVALPNQASYVASKHGVIGLTKAAALEYSAAGVRVNAVCPGVVRTAMIEEVAATDDTFMDKMHAMHAIGRIAEVDEIADAVLWLASPASSFVTGTALSVDGAYTAS
ncbi:glucose 1-dehydrogenase [Rhodococcus sp. NCIMB 12038]|uniref:glucose 1-dehydrogenase n=1 Tax=Rhodococcus sp. NCIMB 12038 TaxID=933800 RepID=UPI000B3CCE2A|nr:glucose 1-dehydrogenase [Rhodococcus sp. NCIMB 12038]OUS79680.1 short chain dehydrogenase [Rhodococcus sp. NCIMB 12038]